MAANPRDVQRFLREANILRELEHPNIVGFREVGESKGQLYFAMEYVPGTDAARLLKKHGPLPIGRAVRLVCQLLEALKYAYAKKFVHRDIKPPVDQYATGATLYNLLTGHFLYDFEGSKKHEIKMILEDKPMPIQSRRKVRQLRQRDAVRCVGWRVPPGVLESHAVAICRAGTPEN